MIKEILEGKESNMGKSVNVILKCAEDIDSAITKVSKIDAKAGKVLASKAKDFFDEVYIIQEDIEDGKYI